jgi:RNA polymerase sigma factor (sigma-70 family)
MALTLSEITPKLVQLAADGDRHAVEAIVRSLERPLFSIASKMLMSRQDAEDATQEALIRIVTHLSQYRAEARFSTWAWRIAVGRILDFRERYAPPARPTFALFAADLAHGRDDDAVERVEDALMLRQLKINCSRAMLHCLDGDHRIAYILGDLLELSSSEAAQILEIEPAALRKRLSRARALLVQFLGGNCGVFNPDAPCACHKRLARARKEGRVAPDSLEASEGTLVALRTQLSTVSELKRLTLFYRGDPDADSRRDFVHAVRATLGLNSSKEPS